MRVQTMTLGLCAIGVAAGFGCTPEEAQAPEEIKQEIAIEAAVAPTAGLVGEWKLNEISGTSAVDTKNGYNASVLGGAAFVAGKIGNGLDFNNGTAGTGGKYAQMPSNATLDNVTEGEYTISAWFYPHSTPTNTTAANTYWAIVAKATPHMGILYNQGGRFLARHLLTGGVGQQATGTIAHPPGAWYHAAAVVSKTAGTVKLYVNGTFEDQAGFTANTAAQDYGTTRFQMGRTGTTWAANGKVDQVRIYNRALSATEVADLFNETVGGTGGPSAVTTNSATNVETNSATLNGSANPNGSATTGWFRYSTTNPGTCNDTFGTRAPASGGTALGTGSSPASYTRAVANLHGGKLYYYCAIASNASGTAVSSNVRSFMAGGMGLRAGLFGMQGNVGQGPGGDPGTPIYKYVHVTATVADIHDEIALADANDVVLMVNPSRSRPNWTVGPSCNRPGNPGDFVWECYEAKVREFEDDTMFARAVAQRRVLLYVVDEPNISSFNGTFTPQKTNEAALLHKEIWPTGLTFVRLSPTLLENGWGGHQAPTSWSGVDYAWVSYAGQFYRQGLTFQRQLEEEKVIADRLDVGIIAHLNIWAGGIKNNFDGVNACWDHDLNSSTPIGVVVGTSTQLPSGVSEGRYYACGTMPSNVNVNMVANPAWIRHYAEKVAAFADVEEIPAVAIWTWPQPGTGVDFALGYIDRSDFVSALDYVVNTTAGRTNWIGYRTPK